MSDLDTTDEATKAVVADLGMPALLVDSALLRCFARTGKWPGCKPLSGDGFSGSWAVPEYVGADFAEAYGTDMTNASAALADPKKFGLYSGKV